MSDLKNTAPLSARAASPRVVIVGGGFGGLHAAKALGHLPVDVTVIDRRNHHTFQPLLYQVALAVLVAGGYCAADPHDSAPPGEYRGADG